MGPVQILKLTTLAVSYKDCTLKRENQSQMRDIWNEMALARLTLPTAY